MLALPPQQQAAAVALVTAGTSAMYTSELPITQWAVDDVAAWLRSLGLGVHAPVFIQVQKGRRLLWGQLLTLAEAH